MECLSGLVEVETEISRGCKFAQGYDTWQTGCVLIWCCGSKFENMRMKKARSGCAPDASRSTYSYLRFSRISKG